MEMDSVKSETVMSDGRGSYNNKRIWSFKTCQGKIDEYNSIWICKWRDWLKGYQLIWESMKSMEGELWYPPRDFDDADMNMLLNWEKGYQINWVLIKLMKGKLWYLLRNFVNADMDCELWDY